MELTSLLSQKTLIVVCIVIAIYFISIVCAGIYFSRFSSNINDFFFSGHRFSWWLPAFSMVATGIGSYSYLKYSQQGYNTGIGSSMVYLNEWLVLPIFIFSWLPILYYNRIKSIPEYFEKRFNKQARYVALTLILAYIFYYIGYNLYTIGLALHGLFGLAPVYTVPFVTCILGLYVTYGGQTAVILTDLFQGILLYLTGFIIVGFGLYALGGLGEFWAYLPLTHRLPFPALNSDPSFNTIGVFWGDALVGSAAFLFMHQGILMRFLSIKSMKSARITALFNIIVCLPLSAITVGAAGWIAKSIMMKQESIGSALNGYETLTITDTYNVFISVAFTLLSQHEWILGIVIATLLAALMSTVDTLINASAAIGVYDIYKPLKPHKSEKHYLRVARLASVCVIAISLLLVIWFFNQKGTLMQIHYKGILTIIPPVVATVFIAVFWSKLDAFSAVWAMIIGGVVTVLTGIWPQPVMYFREFFMGATTGDPVFFRSIFGVFLTSTIAVVIALCRSVGADHYKKISGLTADTLHKAQYAFKGGKPNIVLGEKVKKLQLFVDSTLSHRDIYISQKVGDILKAKIGDHLYIADNRWWLGGLRAGHVKLKGYHNKNSNLVCLSEESLKLSYLLFNKPVFIEKIM